MFDLYLILSYLGLSVCLYLLTPYPILSQHTCGNVPLITLSLTHYLILSYLPILTQKVGGKQGLCAGCPPLYTCGPAHRPCGHIT
jgi:hypothetical protein